MAEKLSDLIKNGGNIVRTFFVKGLIAEAYDTSASNWQATGTASIVLSSDHIATIYYHYTVTQNTDSTNYIGGLKVGRLRALDASIPSITPMAGGYLTLVNVSGEITPETSTPQSSGANGYGAYNHVSTNYPGIWIPQRVYKTDGTTGSWGSSVLRKGYRLFGVALGTWQS